MSVASQVVEQLAAVSGRNRFTLIRMLGTLRAAKLVPKGGPGGGKSSAHFSVGHLANVLLGLAGPEPSDAAEASARLARLRAMKFDPTPHDVHRHMLADRLSGPINADWSFPVPTLGQFIEHLIRNCMKAGGSSEGLAEAVAHADAAGAEWSLELGLSPLAARVLRGTTVDMIFTAGVAAPRAALRVVTVLNMPVILTAADLALDTERHEAAVVQVSRPGKAG